MKTIRGVARFMAKQVLGILLACGVVVGTVIAMFLAALVVALFGFFGATFFLLAPTMGIVMREKLKSLKDAIEEVSVKLNDLTKQDKSNVHPFKKDPT